jgi:crotonobetainyl-CoA:carnitine CoA-transferase CaiB-like acyl-CoA transferase
MTEQSLSGLKVLDLSWYIAGPFCTKLLAAYGADVIKVEKPGKGDPARRIGPLWEDDPHPEKSILFSNLNLNKKSILLDLKKESDKELFKALVKDTDILVENFSPGVMARLGLDYDTLKNINSGLIMTSISNFGQSGPYRDFKVSELVLNGIGADMYSCGIPGRFPLKQGGNCMQYQVGHMAAVATLAAYWTRLNRGIGQHIDISMQEVLASDTDHKMSNLLSWAYSGMSFTTSAMGRTDPREVVSNIIPAGVYPCKDGFVRAQGEVFWWDRFIRLFPEFEKLKWPDDILDVDTYKGEVDAVWYEWCADRTKREIMETCQSVKHFVVAINTPKDCITDPQLNERGFWFEVEHPVTGKQIYPGDPLHAENSPWRIRRPAPLLGEHHEEILAEVKRAANMSVVTGVGVKKGKHQV